MVKWKVQVSVNEEGHKTKCSVESNRGCVALLYAVKGLNYVTAELFANAVCELEGEDVDGYTEPIREHLKNFVDAAGEVSAAIIQWRKERGT